mmetsp:Transcript_9198/g.13446  ORF Transcript_9198/g.13446 Transcript_9198/m.13446 type:complete len:216 (+) Transcript_9198:120-767(+)
MKKNNGTRPKPGRKGDPRMNRAVCLRLANPRMSLVDALVAGGFTFPTKIKQRQNKSEPLILDSDGVSLNQRRNQLSKRLWQARKTTDELLHRSQEKALSERKNLLITIKNKTEDAASICVIETDVRSTQVYAHTSKQMHLLKCSHISQPSLSEAAALNESYKEMCKKDSTADFIRLMDILFEVPTDVLTDDRLTLDELMNKGRILDQTHNQQEAG